MGLWLDRKRLSKIEDSRLLLTVRELFLGSGPDEQVFAELSAEDQEKLEQTIELLCSHPCRTALLGYLERRSGGPESNGCKEHDQ